jgi:hypothetical protein
MSRMEQGRPGNLPGRPLLLLLTYGSSGFWRGLKNSPDFHYLRVALTT